MSVSETSHSNRNDFSDGLRAIAPLVVAAFPIALVFGALAAQKGLTAFETMLMSSVVFAGGSQFVAIDFWASPVPWVALTVSALLVGVSRALGYSYGQRTTRQHSSRADERIAWRKNQTDGVWLAIDRVRIFGRRGLGFV